MRFAAVPALLALTFLCASPCLHAQATPYPPDRLSYQGFLVDGNGSPLGSDRPRNYDLEFRLFDSEAGGSDDTALWGERQTVTVDKGYFSVLLGEGVRFRGDPSLSAYFAGTGASDRWVEVTVRGIGSGGSNARILPRLRLLSSPFAFLAHRAVKLVRTDNGADLISGSGNAVTVSGTISANQFTGSFSGSGANLTQLKAGNIAEGLFAVERIPNLNANKITEGTLNNDRLSSVVARLDREVSFFRHVRIGSLRDGPVHNDPAGYGPALIFSGGPDVTPSWDTDNSDPLWAARYNVADDASELRINIGDHADGRDKLVIGRTDAGSPNFSQTGTWTPVLTVGADGLIQANGGFRARGGAPGVNGDARNGYAFSAPGDPGAGMFSEADGVLQFFSNAGEKMRIQANGYVGIGTANPEVPLHVASSINGGVGGGVRYFSPNLNLTTVTSISGGTETPLRGISIKAHGMVAGSAFLAYSDMRSKEFLGRSNSRNDLAAIRRLQVTDYRMIDAVAHGDRLQKGFLAQEVQAVIPEAVNRGRGFIPSIYATAESLAFEAGTRTLRIQVHKAHGLKCGDKVRLITDQKVSEHDIQEAPDDRTFVVEGFSAKPDRLFVYGPEVTDFLSVEYDRLFTTGIGAIQELARRVETLERSEARVAELEQKLEKMQSLEKEVGALRQIVHQLAAAARPRLDTPVALQTAGAVH